MPIVNVQVAVHRDGAWLIIERSRHEEHAPGELALPGGKVEVTGAADAVLEEPAHREILEETGLRLGPDLTYVHSTSFVTDRGDDVVNVVFLADESTGSASARSGLEVEQVHWMSSDEVLNHPDAPPHLRDSISRAQVSTSRARVSTSRANDSTPRTGHSTPRTGHSTSRANDSTPRTGHSISQAEAQRDG